MHGYDLDPIKTFVKLVWLTDVNTFSSLFHELFLKLHTEKKDAIIRLFRSFFNEHRKCVIGELPSRTSIFRFTKQDLPFPSYSITKAVFPITPKTLFSNWGVPLRASF